MQFQKRYVIGGFFAVVVALTVLVSCLGHSSRAESGPQPVAQYGS